MQNLLTSRSTYKPFLYPWAHVAYQEQKAAEWSIEEIPLADDVKDWNSGKLNDSEKNLLTQIFRFFTQADVDVAKGYLHQYIPIFGHQPELASMLTIFAKMEAEHVNAYSSLLDTIGMPETEYQAFAEYTAMADKHELISNTTMFIDQWSNEDGRVEYTKESLESIALGLAVYSAFTEGLQLFSSFAILLNFSRFGNMKGMGQAITWSIRDESLHVKYMIKLFHTFIEEHPELWTDEFKKKIYEACRTIVDLEDSFIDLAFEQGDVKGLTSAEVKQYIRYIADRRLLQLGLKPNYGVKENPLEWLDSILNGVEHGNFFETRVTEYNKASVVGWEDVWDANS